MGERYSTVGDDEILHIELVKRNHLLLLAPLGANTLAKAALGLCDNLLTAVLRAWPYDLAARCEHARQGGAGPVRQSTHRRPPRLALRSLCSVRTRSPRRRWACATIYSPPSSAPGLTISLIPSLRPPVPSCLSVRDSSNHCHWWPLLR